MTLSDKIEALDGPDRSIDAEIVTTLYSDAQIAMYCVGDDEPTVFHASPLVEDKAELPHFTASVDAALTLIEGKNCDIFGSANEDDPWEVHYKKCSASNQSRALAICAAALRAREAS